MIHLATGLVVPLVDIVSPVDVVDAISMGQA